MAIYFQNGQQDPKSIQISKKPPAKLKSSPISALSAPASVEITDEELMEQAISMLGNLAHYFNGRSWEAEDRKKVISYFKEILAVSKGETPKDAVGPIGRKRKQCEAS